MVWATVFRRGRDLERLIYSFKNKKIKKKISPPPFSTCETTWSDVEVHVKCNLSNAWKRWINGWCVCSFVEMKATVLRQ